MPSDERHASKHHNDFPSGTDTVEPAVSCGMLSDQKLPDTESFLLHVWLVFRLYFFAYIVCFMDGELLQRTGLLWTSILSNRGL